MEIKKLCMIILVLVFMTGCESKYTCTKEGETSNYDYKAQMNLIFKGKKIRKIISNISYDLTDDGYKNISEITDNLNNKGREYTLYDEINVDFTIDNKLITVTEEIDFVNKNKTGILKLLDHSNLSVLYLNSKYLKKDVLNEMKNNNFKCELATK